MAKIIFAQVTESGSEPQQVALAEAGADETLLEAAIAHDVPIQHACGGFCACTTCHVEIVSGAEALSVVEEDEEERLGSLDDRTPSSRLACQARILKPGAEIKARIVNLDY